MGTLSLKQQVNKKRMIYALRGECNGEKCICGRRWVTLLTRKIRLAASTKNLENVIGYL